MNRRRFKQTESLEERLRHQSKRIRLKADSLPPSEERDQLLKKVRDVDMATPYKTGYVRPVSSRRSDSSEPSAERATSQA